MSLKTYRIKNDYIRLYSVVMGKKTLFFYQISDSGGWFRIFERGLCWTTKPLFSVKYGYKKSLKIGKYYISII